MEKIGTTNIKEDEDTCSSPAADVAKHRKSENKMNKKRGMISK